MPAPHIYLDHNSTTSIDPRVLEAMTRAWSECGANPASQHELGRKARRMLEIAREEAILLLGARPFGMHADRVIYTSGGTEANNLALFSMAGEPGDRVIVSSIEHPSIIAGAQELMRRGYDVQFAQVNSDGAVQRESLASLLNDRTRVVSIMLANNETGVIQPVAELAEICHARGALIHTDAVQAIPKIPEGFEQLNVDAMTLAPHKFHGPLGIGALVVKHDVKLKPQLLGGFQQAGERPGTENVPLAVGFTSALGLWEGNYDEFPAAMRSLRNDLERSLRASFPDPTEMVVIGEDAPRLPNTSNVSFPGLNRQALVMALDMAGVACSTGSACASGSSEPSPTLVAMGLAKDVIEGSIRLSLGVFTTAEEVAEASRRIVNTVKHLRSAK
jgi:cysteine desulfurase